MKYICQCCDKKQIGEPTRRRSTLTKAVNWNYCDACAMGEHEPRHWLVLVGRTNGVNAVAKKIKGHKYCGPAILAEELL